MLQGPHHVVLRVVVPETKPTVAARRRESSDQRFPEVCSRHLDVLLQPARQPRRPTGLVGTDERVYAASQVAFVAIPPNLPETMIDRVTSNGAEHAAHET